MWTQREYVWWWGWRARSHNHHEELVIHTQWHGGPPRRWKLQRAQFINQLHTCNKWMHVKRTRVGIKKKNNKKKISLKGLWSSSRTEKRTLYGGGLVSVLSSTASNLYTEIIEVFVYNIRWETYVYAFFLSYAHTYVSSQSENSNGSAFSISISSYPIPQYLY